MAGRTSGNRITKEVPNEVPCCRDRRACASRSSTTAVATIRFYPSVEPDAPPILMHGGLEPTESDPRFHQQKIAYAVAMKALENFRPRAGPPPGKSYLRLTDDEDEDGRAPEPFHLRWWVPPSEWPRVTSRSGGTAFDASRPLSLEARIPI